MHQPDIKIELDTTDLVLEGLAVAGLLLLLLLPAVYYGELPESVPTHFNARGAADGFNGKEVIWALPAFGLLLYGFLTFINRAPHRLNYLVKITTENAPYQYRLATRLTRFLKAFVLLLFAFICWRMIEGALTGNASLGAGFMWVVLGAVFSTIIWYFRAAFRKGGGSKAN